MLPPLGPRNGHKNDNEYGVYQHHSPFPVAELGELMGSGKVEIQRSKLFLI